MGRMIKRIAMLFMVCGLAVNVSFGAKAKLEYPKNYPYYDTIKAEIEKYEAYITKNGGNLVDCEDDYNEFHFYCKAKLGLLLLEEAAVKKMNYFDIYDKMVWKDERFERFRNTDLDTNFKVIKSGFKEFYEKRKLKEAWRHDLKMLGQ